MIRQPVWPALIKVYSMIQELEDDYWKAVKSKEIKDIIAACMGLYLEAIADDFSATPGQESRAGRGSHQPVQNRLPPGFRRNTCPWDWTAPSIRPLTNNQVQKFWKTISLPLDMPKDQSLLAQSTMGIGHVPGRRPNAGADCQKRPEPFRYGSIALSQVPPFPSTKKWCTNTMMTSKAKYTDPLKSSPR